MRPTAALFVLLVSSAIASAQTEAPLSIKTLPPGPETPKEMGIARYNYSLYAGGVLKIEIEGTGAKKLGDLEIRWLPEQGAEMLFSSPEGRRIRANWNQMAGSFQFEDLKTGETVEIILEKRDIRLPGKPWRVTGSRPGFDLDEFKAREGPLMSLLAFTYSDAITNLGIGPERQIIPPPGDSAPGCSGPPLCDGPLVIINDAGLTISRCCTAATAAANLECRFLSAECAGCCRAPCFVGCLFSDGTFCTCTVEAQACGSRDFCGDDEWPPTCT